MYLCWLSSGRSLQMANQASLGSSPDQTKIMSIYGRLIETIDLFLGDLVEDASMKRSLMQDPRIANLQSEVAVLASSPNVRDSEVRLEIPGPHLVDLCLNPRSLLTRITKDGYFYKDKAVRLLALRCVEESKIEHVELPSGKIVAASDVRNQLASVLDSPRFKTEGIGYYTGYKWRSDPHCGVAVNTDYVYCRPNNAKTPKERDKALVLFYPRVSLRNTSSSHQAIVDDLKNIQTPRNPMFEHFAKRYAADKPEERRETLRKTGHLIGIWRESTKQARIFRRYCDLIVLSDAILLGNHWKSP